ncbi:hypothetical protein THAOC_11039 [Thalassiosira oceanica]|uniref:Uncharacterized protein n=1 Tax=Thalassiosira oceanica TaxID=159749 RepID=K0SNK7_THAOC|nr:hypothetical protein THAOC_11039 [Thalassiosira oceanica]|eukprot:EJK67863.1 hypothetical protein THAOC_11039 [Thalassiosira oceanica]
MKLARRCFAAQDAVDDAQYLAMPSEFLRGQRRAHAMAEESEGVPGPSGGVRRTRTWDDRGDGRAGGADGTIRHSASFGPSCIRQHGHAGGVRELHHENRRLDLRRGGIASLGGVLSTDDAVPSSGREPPKTSKERDEIGRLNGELAECRAEIGRLRSAMARHSRGPGRSQLVLNRSMLSDSESDDGDANGGAPAVALSPSQGDESYVRWQRRFEREMELECRREILLLRASLEKANRRLAAVGGGDGGDAGGAPFASDIEPIATSGDDDGVFLRIAEDLENDNDGPEDGGRARAAKRTCH